MNDSQWFWFLWHWNRDGYAWHIDIESEGDAEAVDYVSPLGWIP